ncbi:UNVERIFIED_ORG: hypothetical protein BDU10_8505 [Burkholderia sp. CF145]|nr:hypothetical protein PMI06_001606 [Burkholderia sp. BT03]SKD06860.1 hypothetical protein SAMN06266956_9457 [Paraburkholderia hospita]
MTPLLFSVVRPVSSSLSAILSSTALLPAGVLWRGVARGGALRYDDSSRGACGRDFLDRARDVVCAVGTRPDAACFCFGGWLPSVCGVCFDDAASLLGRSTGLFLTLRDLIPHGASAGWRAWAWRCSWGRYATTILRAALVGGISVIGAVTSCARWAPGQMWLVFVLVVGCLPFAAFVLVTPLLFSVVRPVSSSLSAILSSTALPPAGVLWRCVARGGVTLRRFFARRLWVGFP